jgi:DNA-binding PadR family transcriptional regulator
MSAATGMDQPHATVAYFWEARCSQIHPELQRLLPMGLVAFEAAPGPGPRDKKVYSVTEQGREALRRWWPEPPRPLPARSELLLKAFGIWAADRAAAHRLFEQQAAVDEERLAEDERQWAAVESRHDGAPLPDHPTSVTTRPFGAASATSDTSRPGATGWFPGSTRKPPTDHVRNRAADHQVAPPCAQLVRATSRTAKPINTTPVTRCSQPCSTVALAGVPLGDPFARSWCQRRSLLARRG